MDILSDKDFQLLYKNYSHAIIIRDPGQEIPSCASYLDSYLCLHFHDIGGTLNGYIPPNEYHIEAAINYSKLVDLDKLAITCWAGISRSSAIAFAISLYNKKNWEEAHKILDKNKHMPNDAIMRMLYNMWDKCDKCGCKVINQEIQTDIFPFDSIHYNDCNGANKLYPIWLYSIDKEVYTMSVENAKNFISKLQHCIEQHIKQSE